LRQRHLGSFMQVALFNFSHFHLSQRQSKVGQTQAESRRPGRKGRQISASSEWPRDDAFGDREPGGEPNAADASPPPGPRSGYASAAASPSRLCSHAPKRLERVLAVPRGAEQTEG
jgi:hypothetical protein